MHHFKNKFSKYLIDMCYTLLLIEIDVHVNIFLLNI